MRVADLYVKTVEVPSDRLRPHPHNWRVHPAAQRQQMLAVMAEIGLAAPIIARELPDGYYQCLDGHMRADLLPAGQPARLYVIAADDQLAAKIVASFDQVGQSAESDLDRVKELLAQAALDAPALIQMGEELLAAATERFRPALLPLADLKPHPRNYRRHPDDQLAHLGRSIQLYGFTRNIIVAADRTILAGHGVAEAARRVGKEYAPVLVLDLGPDDPLALRLLAGDNEVTNLAEVDDRKLLDMLRGIADGPLGLDATGFSRESLAAAAMTSRTAAELKDKNSAAEWAGMPAYEDGGIPIRLVVTFQTEADRQAFVDQAELRIDKVAGQTWSTRWPWTDREDVSGVRFETPGAREGSE